MKLWLARHAQPLIAAGICYGRLDVAADAGATAECARRLAFQLPAGIRVLASPLQRCRQLAQALQALRPDLVFQSDARLQEMDFGRWEGRAWDAIAQSELQAWTDDFAHYAVGLTGESVTAFMARVASALDGLGGEDSGWEPVPQALTPVCAQTERAHSSQARQLAGQKGCALSFNQGAEMLWITHAGVIRAVQLLAQGLRHIEHAGQWPLDAPNYGQWQTLEWPIQPAHPEKISSKQASRSG
jgi:alpha-ribazole phosphatase